MPDPTLRALTGWFRIHLYKATSARIEAEAETQAVTCRALREEAGLSQAHVELAP